MQETNEYYKKRNFDYYYNFYEINCVHNENEERVRIIHIFDPPHLLKGIRNNLLKKNLMFTMDGVQYEAKWIYII